VRKTSSKARKPETKPTPAKGRTSSRRSDEATVKATFYLSQETIDGLEDAWLHLRRASESNHRGAITKSLLVRLAIELALEDMKGKGASSQLMRRLEQRS
jgi:L-alanine-DL-glutamate epimerase-like enolase superfamily enzyme